MSTIFFIQALVLGIALLLLGGIAGVYVREWLVVRRARRRSWLKNRQRERRREIYNIAFDAARIVARQYQKQTEDGLIDKAARLGCQRAMAWVESREAKVKAEIRAMYDEILQNVTKQIDAEMPKWAEQFGKEISAAMKEAAE